MRQYGGKIKIKLSNVDMDSLDSKCQIGGFGYLGSKIVGSTIYQIYVVNDSDKKLLKRNEQYIPKDFKSQNYKRSLNSLKDISKYLR